MQSAAVVFRFRVDETCNGMLHERMACMCGSSLFSLLDTAVQPAKAGSMKFVSVRAGELHGDRRIHSLQ